MENFWENVILLFHLMGSFCKFSHMKILMQWSQFWFVIQKAVLKINSSLVKYSHLKLVKKIILKKLSQVSWGQVKSNGIYDRPIKNFCNPNL